ncbi:MAG: hypothetical protein AB2A00_11320 [Myxococcota bacterium]
MRIPFRVLSLTALVSVAACTEGGTSTGSTSSSGGPTRPPVYQTSVGLKACANATLEDGVPLQEGQRCYTYRALGGVSMGGGSAARIAFHYPELFDAVGVMGTPFSDFDAFWNMISQNHMAGFCSREELEAILAANPNNPEVLDDPNTPGVWCGRWGNQVEENPALPETACWQFASDYNHWYRGPDAGRGGSFKRASLMEIIQDIASTYGNVAYYNPESEYLPPGVPLSYHVPLDATNAERDQMRAELCANPLRLTGFKHKEYNPDGTYPVITYCDCHNCDGDYVPGLTELPTEVLLAVDYNDNGRRDYAEPVLWMPNERYRDVGTDGKADDEAGDELTDDYHYLDNPAGLSGNHRYDEGEPFDDDGLDGIPNTGDYGEGDGEFTMTPALKRALEDSPTRWYLRMSDAMVQRMDVWMDAGIRDFINSAQITNNLFGAIRMRNNAENTRYYKDFSGLANLPPGNNYDYHEVDFSPSSLGKNAYLLYGNPAICPGHDSTLGDGNHVGPADQVINRLLTLFKFVDERMPGGDWEYINSPSAVDDHPDGFDAHLKMETYHSEALGREQEYGIVVPPGYYYPENAEKRYPVVFFLHGQGQSARDLLASGFVFLGAMHQSSRTDILDRSDLQKMFLVFADGECKLGDCHTGNFYSNFQGVNGDGKQFEQAFLELMQHIDASYRTKAPEVH